MDNQSSSEFTVDQSSAGLRLDRFLAGHFEQLSRGRLQTEIAAGRCTVDGCVEKRADVRLKAGQRVLVSIGDGTPDPTKLDAEDEYLEILYRDASLCVVNKPAGLTVHPCPSCRKNTVVQRLLSVFPSLRDMEGERPGIVHRLDKDTSGVMVVALTEASRLKLASAFATHAVYKEYVALVAGVPEAEGICTLPLGRDPIRKTKMCVLEEKRGGREAKTTWKRLWVAPDTSCSLLSLRIHTGRTHQIRVHMSHLGFPLLGDALYANAQIAGRAPRQMLHARSLSFTHPVKGETLSFTQPPPKDFLETCRACSHDTQRVIITGNPGGGKSTVTTFFRNKGLPCFSADDVVTQLYTAKGEIASWFLAQGREDLLEHDGSVNKSKVYESFTKDPVFKRDFEAQIHRCVRAQLEAFFECSQRSRADCAVAEVPLWFECSWPYPNPLLTVCVFCPQEKRFTRLHQTRGWSRDKAVTVDAWQWEETRKANACDYVLNNAGTLDDLAAELQKLEDYLLGERKRRARDQETFLRQCLCGKSSPSAEAKPESLL